MTNSTAKIYSFGRFQLDENERLLFDGEQTLPIAPRVFDTLLLLVKNAGRILSKEKMLKDIWEDSFVEENNLAQNISFLRRILGETKDLKFIETVPKFGYRFIAPVEIIENTTETVTIEHTQARVLIREVTEFDDDLETVERAEREVWETGFTRPSAFLPLGPSPALPSAVPETRYVQNGDVNIAYQVVGNGELDIVFVMGWVSHLEFFWKHHLFASFLNRLASFSRLILFDKRGTGLSDRVPLSQLPTLEQRMEDVHAVMDAVGSERAVLIGVSEGGPMCSLFAATYPEKTSALVMIGTYAKRLKDEDYPWGPTPAEHQQFYELMQRDWGKPVGIETRAPSMVLDAEFRSWWSEYLRNGASPGAAVALTKMNAEIDVRQVLPLVQVPTLVIHRAGDMCLKVEEGRYVADLIRGSKYVEFNGLDHLPFVGDQAEILDEIEEFLTGMRQSEEIDRILATVLRIQIIRAEEQDFESGEWSEMLKRAGVFVRRQIELFKGREMTISRVGIEAAFDGPARAIRCALAINESAQRLELNLKTGLHTGECEVRNGSYGGLAVELAGKIADCAALNEILASRTVKDLVAGSGLNFEEHSRQTFDDFSGEWRIFRVRK